MAKGQGQILQIGFMSIMELVLGVVAVIGIIALVYMLISGQAG